MNIESTTDNNSWGNTSGLEAMEVTGAWGTLNSTKSAGE